MKIIISGYGRMGREVEKTAIAGGHEVVRRIDDSEEWQRFKNTDADADVVIDFSQPDCAVENIIRCFHLGLPIVTGTTGWLADLEKVTEACRALDGSLFHAPNFSIGVNILFHLNVQLARVMSSIGEYAVSIRETHHIHKKDAPSGTAIRIAEDIMQQQGKLKRWVNREAADEKTLPVLSERTGEVPGLHIVRYESSADILELRHEAKDRSGFARGALMAAEWLLGKKGIFTMDDLLASWL